MTVRAERDGNEILVVAPLTYKDRCREVAGARWDSKARVWRYPLSWAHCVMLRGVFGAELEVAPRLVEWASEEVSSRVYPAMTMREETE